MKVNSLVEKRLLKVYKGKAEEFIASAKVLFYLTASLSIVAVVLNLVIESKGNEKLVIGGMAAVFALLALLVVFGKASFSSLFTSYFLAIVLSSMPFLSPELKGYLEYYFIGFMNLFAISITAVIGVYAWQSFPIIGVSIGALVLDLRIRVKPYAIMHGSGKNIDDIAIILTMISLAAISFYIVFRRTGRFISIAREESTRAEKQLDILKAAMEASTEALSQGEKLVKSASSTSQLTVATSDFLKLPQSQCMLCLIPETAFLWSWMA